MLRLKQVRSLAALVLRAKSLSGIRMSQQLLHTAEYGYANNQEESVPKQAPKKNQFYDLESVKPKTLFEQEKQAQELFYQSYKHIRVEYLIEGNQAAKALILLDGQLLDECCSIFYREFLTNRDKVPRYLAQAISKCLSEKLDRFLTEEERAIVEDPFKASDKAIEVFGHLKVLMEIIDKGNKGLLTGDLHPKLIDACSKAIPDALKQLNEDKNGFENILETMYSSIANSAFQELFKLPFFGILHPDLENQRNLFERQLVLEQESQTQAVNKFLKVFDDLNQFGLTVNVGFAKKYIMMWFPNLCKVIKDEQQQCLLGEIRGERKYYASYLTKISAEKIAVLSLTELMRQILKISNRFKESVDNMDQSELSVDCSLISKQIFLAIGEAVNLQFIYDQEEKLLKEKERENLNELATKIVEKQESTQEEATARAKKYLADKTKEANLKLMENLYKKKGSTIKQNYEDMGIPKTVQYKLGSLLLYLMKETIKIQNEQNFWVHLLVPSYKKSRSNDGYVGIINVNENFVISLYEHSDKADSPFMHLDRCLPMIYKPAPWQDAEIGGYYQRPTNLMRVHESPIQKKVLANADLSPMFNILNTVGQTAWRINKPVK